jgi:hypothetical protein
MDREPTLEELERLVAAAELAHDALNTALDGDDEVAKVEAAFRYQDAVVALGRGILSDPTMRPQLRREVISDLLGVHERMEQMAVASLRTLVDLVLTPADALAPGVSAEDQVWGRDVLLGNGLLTASELDAFPRSSLYAIAEERFRRWRETGDPRG